LIVLGYDNRVLGVKEVSSAELYAHSQDLGINITSVSKKLLFLDKLTNMTQSELNRTTFGVQAIPIGDLNGNGVSELVVTLKVWKQRLSFWDSLTALPERTITILIYLNLDGSVSQLRYLPEPAELLSANNGTSLWGTSVGAVGDVDGDGMPDIAIGVPRCQTTRGPTGCIYIVSVGKNDADLRYIPATTNALTDTLLPDSRFAGSLVSINNTQGALLLTTFDRTRYV